MPSKYSFLPCLQKKEKDADGSFLRNGSILLEDLIASCDGKLSNPIRHYSADELIKATNNFHSSSLVLKNALYNIFTGFLDNRLVIIKKEGRRDDSYCNFDQAKNEVIRDIIISMQMSAHKNVMKLLGCCLEFPIPALVLEYSGKGVLNAKGGLEVDESLTWRTRLCVAKQLANAITYLHTGFPRPIIHRNLKHSCIFLDDDSVPKISDFSDSITIPPEQSHVEDLVKGTNGYLDPAYRRSGCITEKTDVYSFGVILLVFLTGRHAMKQNQAAEMLESVVSYVESHACDGQFLRIVDPKILEESGGQNEQAQKQQLHDFLTLALLCTQDKDEARPYMIDVAKELARIEKSNESLPWNSRLRIAKQLASAITYLHTAFPRPIIHRHLRPHCIFLDADFVPKLCDFSYSITIPPEKSHVEDVVIKGTMCYLSPEFLDSGYISEKFDVYSFGVILLGLLAGRIPLAGHDDLIRTVKLHASVGHIKTIVDPKLLEEFGGNNEQQLQDFLALVWLCTEDESELRPDMIDVAKELTRIEKSISSRR